MNPTLEKEMEQFYLTSYSVWVQRYHCSIVLIVASTHMTVHMKRMLELSVQDVCYFSYSVGLLVCTAGTRIVLATDTKIALEK